MPQALDERFKSKKKKNKLRKRVRQKKGVGKRLRKILTWWGKEPIVQFNITFIKGTFMDRTKRNPKVLVETVGKVI